MEKIGTESSMVVSIVEHPFPGSSKMEGRRYCVFPDALENDPLVLFHATIAEDYDNILRVGFKTAADLGKAEGLQSVSYAKRSSGALSHIRGRYRTEEVIIIAVEFASVVTRTGKDSNSAGMVVNTDDIHVYDGTQPKIIGFCRIPDGYAFL